MNVPPPIQQQPTCPRCTSPYIVNQTKSSGTTLRIIGVVLMIIGIPGLIMAFMVGGGAFVAGFFILGIGLYVAGALVKPIINKRCQTCGLIW